MAARMEWKPPITFQSAPRSEERGDVEAMEQASRGDMFQSAPRSEERGDTKRTTTTTN